MEMLVPVPLILSLTRLAPAKVRTAAARRRPSWSGRFFCLDRARNARDCRELVILAALLVKQKRGLRTAVGIGVFMVIVIGLLVWIGGAELGKRLATAGPATPNSPAIFAPISTATAFACF